VLLLPLAETAVSLWLQALASLKRLALGGLATIESSLGTEYLIERGSAGAGS